MPSQLPNRLLTAASQSLTALELVELRSTIRCRWHACRISKGMLLIQSRAVADIVGIHAARVNIDSRAIAAQS
jgi:hypothetical protein